MIPQFRWGTVTATGSVHVQFDGPGSPVPVASTLAPVSVGDRVLVLVWLRRSVILGVSAARPTSGTITDIPATPGFAQYGSTYARSVTLTPPFDPPPGYYFHYFTRASSGFTTVENAGGNNVRIIQVGSNSIPALTAIGWQLKKA
nr:MAG TPA_asm: hypothetical protein [Caudoviricetes sp.]